METVPLWVVAAVVILAPPAILALLFRWNPKRFGVERWSLLRICFATFFVWVALLFTLVWLDTCTAPEPPPATAPPPPWAPPPTWAPPPGRAPPQHMAPPPAKPPPPPTMAPPPTIARPSVTAPPGVDIPEFPWPPPDASASIVLPTSFVLSLWRELPSRTESRWSELATPPRSPGEFAGSPA